MHVYTKTTSTDGKIRTLTMTRVWNPSLYQLSYIGVFYFIPKKLPHSLHRTSSIGKSFLV